MGKGKDTKEILTALTLVGQLGLSFVIPPLLCTLLGVYLTRRFEIGVWLILVLVAVGLLVAGCGVYRTLAAYIARVEKSSTPTHTRKEPPDEKR